MSTSFPYWNKIFGLVINWRTYIRSELFRDDHGGKIQTKDYELSTDPDSQNTFWVGFLIIVYIYMHIRRVSKMHTSLKTVYFPGKLTLIKVFTTLLIKMATCQSSSVVVSILQAAIWHRVSYTPLYIVPLSVTLPFKTRFPIKTDKRYQILSCPKICSVKVYNFCDI